ncbi:MAG: hypothetical protein IJE84_04270 [Clostridia bacterium]|nr:hypothetical protein [Clostridia bacterium]
MTKRLLSVFLVAIMCVSTLAPLLSLEADAADSYKAISFSTPIAVGDNGGYPRLENLPDGTLLLASSSSTSVLRLMRSTDNGKNWGESETIVDYTGTDYNPGNGYLFYDTQTETLFFTYRCPIESTDSSGNVISYTANINYVSSTDGGVNWSEPKTICTATGPTQETGGGMWEPTFYRIDGKLRVYYSSDVVKYNGGVKLNVGTKYERYDTTYPYSPSIVTQNIVMHEYNDATGEWSGGVAVFDGYTNLDRDYGYPEGTVKMRAGMQSITKLNDGTYAMTIETTKLRDWANYGGTNFPMVIDICFSRDGVNFTEPRTIVQGHADGYTSAAPWCATLPDGRIAVSFQTDDDHDQPMPTEVGNYKQLHVVVSHEAVTYEDADTISIDNFDRYRPFNKYNSEVTFNYWNSMYVHGYTLYAVGNHNTNDKSVTAAKGMLISTVDLTPGSSSTVPSGYTPLYTANDIVKLMNRETGYVWNDKYVLMNDIDMSTATLTGVSPIGMSADASFSGIFDGKGYTISGLNITGSGAYTGLFGHTTDATIRNLTVSGSIKSTYAAQYRYDNGCGVIGCASGGTWVQNVTNDAAVSASSTAGGVIGYLYKDTNTSRNLIVQNCVNNGSVTSTATNSKGAAGGIIGCSNALIADISVKECINNGAVSGFRYVGGIVGGTQHEGIASDGLFYTKAVKCVNNASVNSKNNDCGGIFGLAWYSTLESCMNYGNIASAVTTKAANVGGIVGRAHVYVSATACYSNGTQSAYGYGVNGTGKLGTEVSFTDCYFGLGRDDAYAAKVTGDAAGLFSSYPGLDFLNTFEIRDGVVYLLDTSVIRMGDVNANKTIDNTDMTLLIRTLAGWTEKKYKADYADLTADGKVNNRDAIKLAQMLAGWQY